MKIPILSQVIFFRFVNRKRAVLRGYNYLKEQRELNKLNRLKNEFTDTPFAWINQASSRCIFGAGMGNPELIVRQFLIGRIAGLKFNESVLASLGRTGYKVIHPLPPQWRLILEKNGLKTSKYRSSILWYLFLLKMGGYGFAFAAIFLLRSLWNAFTKTLVDADNFVYFDSLKISNLPSKHANSYDIVSWYMQWCGRLSKLDSIRHNLRSSPERKIDEITIGYMDQIPSLNIIGLVKFMTWLSKASILAIFDLFRGRWWHLLMFYEATKSSAMRLQDDRFIAKEYLFHNSSWIFRPLWTYEAEQKGATITLYFYSTNCESFKTSEGYPIQGNSWQLMTWNRYLVWNDYQANFVRRAIGEDAKVIVAGCIWFQSTYIENIVIPENSIAVFDVQPYRESFYQTLGDASEYYTLKTSLAFVNDIVESVEDLNFNIVFKRKREIGKLGIRAYNSSFETLEKGKAFLSVNSNISPQLLIDKCQAVISMPFTSTALIGKDMGKPSAFYDPHGKVQKDDRAAHGIEILTGPEELKLWLKGIKKKSTFEPS